MEMFVLVLNHTELLNDILKDMLDGGFKGATVVDCRGILRELDAGTDDDAPMMGVLRHFHAPERSRCKLVMAAIDEAERPRLLKIVNDRTGGLSKVDAGIAFTVPLGEIRGITRKEPKRAGRVR